MKHALSRALKAIPAVATPLETSLPDGNPPFPRRILRRQSFQVVLSPRLGEDDVGEKLFQKTQKARLRHRRSDGKRALPRHGGGSLVRTRGTHSECTGQHDVGSTRGSRGGRSGCG